MKLYPDCMPCFLKRIHYEIKLVSGDDELARKILRECSRIMGNNACTGVNSAALSTVLHRKAYDMMGNKDPYKKMKDESNKVAQKLFSKADKLVKKSNDPFQAAVMVSIVGNIFDYGITDFRDPNLLLGTFEKMCADGLGYDDTEKIKKLLRNSQNILFFTDNCGEIVFDKLLLREIRKINRAMHTTLVPKGTPILSDATVEDVYQQGVDKLVDKVVPTESFAVGVDLEKMSRRFQRMLDRADLIICKGMANYEAFSGTSYNPIAYLMRTKCSPVADSLGIEKNISAAMLIL